MKLSLFMILFISIPPVFAGYLYITQERVGTGTKFTLNWAQGDSSLPAGPAACGLDGVPGNDVYYVFPNSDDSGPYTPDSTLHGCQYCGGSASCNEGYANGIENYYCDNQGYCKACQDPCQTDTCGLGSLCDTPNGLCNAPTCTPYPFDLFAYDYRSSLYYKTFTSTDSLVDDKFSRKTGVLSYSRSSLSPTSSPLTVRVTKSPIVDRHLSFGSPSWNISVELNQIFIFNGEILTYPVRYSGTIFLSGVRLIDLNKQKEFLFNLSDTSLGYGRRWVPSSWVASYDDDIFALAYQLHDAYKGFYISLFNISNSQLNTLRFSTSCNISDASPDSLAFSYPYVFLPLLCGNKDTLARINLHSQSVEFFSFPNITSHLGVPQTPYYTGAYKYNHFKFVILKDQNGLILADDSRILFLNLSSRTYKAFLLKSSGKNWCPTSGSYHPVRYYVKGVLPASWGVGVLFLEYVPCLENNYVEKKKYVLLLTPDFYLFPFYTTTGSLPHKYAEGVFYPQEFYLPLQRFLPSSSLPTPIPIPSKVRYTTLYPSDYFKEHDPGWASLDYLQLLPFPQLHTYPRRLLLLNPKKIHIKIYINLDGYDGIRTFLPSQKGSFVSFISVDHIWADPTYLYIVLLNASTLLPFGTCDAQACSAEGGVCDGVICKIS